MVRRIFVSAFLTLAASAALADTRQDCERSAILKKDLDAKIRACTKIIDRDRQAAWAYIGRGQAYRWKDDYDRAIGDYSRAIEIDPKSASAYFNRGAAYEARRLIGEDSDYDRAMADYTRAIEIEPKVEFYVGRAAAYGMNAMIVDAVRNQERAAADRESAIADYTKAIEIAPSEAFYWSRARHHEKLGRREAAIADYWEAVALDPFTRLSWDDLRRLLKQADKRDAADAPSPSAPTPTGVRTLPRLPEPLAPAEERALQPGDSFKECDACPEMVVVPAGEFIMGSPLGEAGRDVTEGPQRKVTIARPFAAGRYEVTFAEWDACVAAGGCKRSLGDAGWGRGRRPAIFVTSEEIKKEYLPWLARTTGKQYRLLSEAEWEYAARAGTTTRYAFGDTITAKQARLSETKGGGVGKTAEVGSFPPNAFGLYDMHGNVRELVADSWHAYHRAPIDGSVVRGKNFHVLRGGSWNSPPDFVRSALRYYESIWPKERSTNEIGFRVARSLAP
jgi:formylglycine-generating enzyme required for sulfatase activity/Tfp pilus assembly protein PilF